MSDPLEKISLVTANYGNGETFAGVLADWFAFLSAKPAEVVVVDAASPQQTQDVCRQLQASGKIDKLLLLPRDHPRIGKEYCFIQEHTAAQMASRPYILFFKSDTLVYRQGHDDWLARAIESLDRPDTFAVGGSFNRPCRHHDAETAGWYFTDKCSLNFALMKRERYFAAINEFAPEYVASNFTSASPLSDDGKASQRYFIESAWEAYMQKHKQFTLARVEDLTWTIFHTNIQGEELISVRRDFKARRDIEKYLNAGNVIEMHSGCYYGMKRNRLKEFRIALGATRFGKPWRALKRRVFG